MHATINITKTLASVLLASLVLLQCSSSVHALPQGYNTKPTDGGDSDAGGPDVSMAMLPKVNALRSGLTPYVYNALLAKACIGHAQDMASHTTMSHTGSDGSSPMERAKAAGYDSYGISENVAYGYKTIDEVMDGWIHSSGHYANLVRPESRHFAAAVAVGSDGNKYWSQCFGYDGPDAPGSGDGAGTPTTPTKPTETPSEPSQPTEPTEPAPTSTYTPTQPDTPTTTAAPSDVATATPDVPAPTTPSYPGKPTETEPSQPSQSYPHGRRRRRYGNRGGRRHMRRVPYY